MKPRALKTGAAVLAVAATLAAPAAADTLRDAMASAYANNPVLAGERAAQQITSERLAQTVGAMRPTIGAQGVFDQETSSPGKFDDRSRLVTVGVELRQPIWHGGTLRNNVHAADQRVLSGRELLRQTENQTILDTVIVYMDVLRLQSEADLTANQVKVLERELQASRDRFEVGDLTRTDVAQSEARLELARSQNIAAEGALANAKAAYERVVGRVPVDLQPPPALPPLPGTQDQAIAQALSNNPLLISAKREEAAARYDVAAVKGERLPSIDATFSVGYTNFRGTVGAGSGIRSGGTDFTQNIGATLTLPLYQGGVMGSRIREAQARRSQRQQDVYQAERTTIEDARAAWENLLSARATIESAQVAVDANTLALEGARAENQVGTRTVLDVLNAEQELLNAQVTLVRAQRDAYVAGYNLLATIGKAEADDLGLPVEIYRAIDYTRGAKGELMDWFPGIGAQTITPPVTSEPAPGTMGPPVPADAASQQGVTAASN
jgi:outer membrane protein